jgi:signal transduction histidine kinase
VDRLEHRALLLVPTPKDAALTSAVLGRAGVATDRCATLEELCGELDAGAAVVLLAEEMVGSEPDPLTRWLARQPPWSDLPIMVLARPGADSAAVAGAIERLGNVTVLERPIRIAALVSTTRVALRARQRQYQIREHLRERARAEAALRVLDRRKDEFLAMLAHELRNPLAPISNSLHILSLTMADDPAVRRVVEMMERQVAHLVRLVDDLLEMSRINQGKIALRRELVELAVVVRTAVEASRPLIDAAGHRLSVSIPPDPITLHADPVRVAQVLENLLNNSAKYTPKGGEIALAVVPENGTVRISVRDSGAGIPAELLPRVFDLFAQVEQAGRRSGGGGLGIGLTLVKSLVELHGGRVEARSEGPGRGSEFTAILPRVATPATPPPQAPRPALSRLPPRRVMVVDDNRDAADSLGALLRSLGCEVTVAYSGAEALARLGREQPKVVLLDIGMPELDGHEVARRIRRLEGFDRVTLIALTGWGQEQDMDRSRAAGFDHHLIKPADLGALETLLLEPAGAG